MYTTIFIVVAVLFYIGVFLAVGKCLTMTEEHKRMSQKIHEAFGNASAGIRLTVTVSLLPGGGARINWPGCPEAIIIRDVEESVVGTVEAYPPFNSIKTMISRLTNIEVDDDGRPDTPHNITGSGQ